MEEWGRTIPKDDMKEEGWKEMAWDSCAAMGFTVQDRDGKGAGRVEEDEEEEEEDDYKWAINKWEAWQKTSMSHEQREGTFDCVNRLVCAITEMEKGRMRALQLHNVVREEELAFAYGGCDEFVSGRYGLNGDEERLLLAWALLRRDREERRLLGIVDKCRGRWRAEYFDDWLDEYDRQYLAEAKWHRVVSLHGLQWGLDVCGSIGTTEFGEEDRHIAEVRKLGIGIAIAKRCRWCMKLAARMMRQRAVEKRGKDLTENKGEAKCDAGDDNGDITQDDAGDGRGSRCHTRDDGGGNCGVGDDSGDDGNGDVREGKDGTRHNWQLLLVHVGLMLMCALSVVMWGCRRMQQAAGKFMGKQHGQQAGSVGAKREIQGQQHEVKGDVRSEAIRKGVMEARRQRATWRMMQAMSDLADRRKQGMVVSGMRRRWGANKVANMMQRLEVQRVLGQMRQRWEERDVRPRTQIKGKRRLNITEVGGAAKAKATVTKTKAQCGDSRRKERALLQRWLKLYEGCKATAHQVEWERLLRDSGCSETVRAMMGWEAPKEMSMPEGWRFETAMEIQEKQQKKQENKGKRTQKKAKKAKQEVKEGHGKIQEKKEAAFVRRRQVEMTDKDMEWADSEYWENWDGLTAGEMWGMERRLARNSHEMGDGVMEEMALNYRWPD